MQLELAFGESHVVIINWRREEKQGRTSLVLSRREHATAAVKAWEDKVSPGVIYTYEVVEIWGEFK